MCLCCGCTLIGLMVDGEERVLISSGWYVTPWLLICPWLTTSGNVLRCSRRRRPLHGTPLPNPPQPTDPIHESFNPSHNPLSHHTAAQSSRWVSRLGGTDSTNLRTHSQL